MLVALLATLAPSLIILLTMSALLSASETSMTAASRGRLHQLERDGDPAARRINRLLTNQETMIGAILLANNVINIGASALTTSVLSAAFPGVWGALIATAVMTVLVVVFSEILPKTLAIARADDVARTLSIPTYWTVRIFGPLADGAQWIVRQTLRPFGIRLDAGTDVLAAHEEIRGAVEYHHSEGLVETRDRYMLGGVLDLSEMDVSEVMIHRRSMATLDGGLAPREMLRQALDSNHTRVPVYRDEPDNIVGVLHLKDLLNALVESDGDIERIDIPDILREPWFIPETTSLKDQLAAFLKRQNHFALVVDEYGALQGLVTLEDILEEIVGEIEDEHDVTAVGVKPLPDGAVMVEGSVTIRDLNRAMNWDLPDDEAVTVAGLLIHEAQAIPEVGQTYTFHRHRFSVVARKGARVTSLRVEPLPPADDDED
ncbi:MAG: HlyC/CorC family transporter [Phenylobacterium sp.]|uniref:HlyC/CorC family transporter n=1 Tax=Phenylobacterium sp. TaxID=1871053 RepID=UPI001A5ACCCA|nr:HlyC/CorC family transporter [Phenylobacterium sp.]MBL8554292.1 HlyC/CorC family transporter [Phenylobacterium sp.]